MDLLPTKDISEEIQGKFDHGPTVGISILNFNGTRDTVECITSIIRHQEVPSLISILENGSSEDEKKSLRDEIQRLGQYEFSGTLDSDLSNITYSVYTIRDKPHCIVLLDSDTNLGFCVGNNLNVELFDSIDAPYSLVLNNDARFTKDNLSKSLIEALDSIDDAAAVSPHILEPDGTIWYTGGSYSDWDYRYKKDMKPDGFGYEGTIKSDTVYKTHLYSGCCVLYKTEIYQDVGGMYNPNFISIDEPEMSKRIEDNNHTIIVDPRTSIVHEVGETLTRGGYFYHDYFYIRNKLLYSKTHNSRSNHLKNTAMQFTGYLKPLFENFGAQATERTSNGLQAVKDYYRGRLGPGTFWKDLNSLPYDHPIWDPDSDWNSSG